MEGGEIWKKLINAIYGKKDRWRTINGGVWKNIGILWEDLVNLQDWMREMEKEIRFRIPYISRLWEDLVNLQDWRWEMEKKNKILDRVTGW